VLEYSLTPPFRYPREEGFDRMMSVWKRLKRWEKVLIMVLTLLLLISIVLYIRDYYWALDEAFEACSKGDFESCQDLRNYANSRIINMFVALMTYLALVSIIIGYRYRKGG
jgi:predicted nucleic acid-binding Zn ribbon protein